MAAEISNRCGEAPRWTTLLISMSQVRGKTAHVPIGRQGKSRTFRRTAVADRVVARSLDLKLRE